jgi:tetratricopeptide (TPR) repeat protein
LRGQYALGRFDVLRAEQLFKEAIARDGKFARAYAYLSLTYSEVPVLGIASLDSSLALAQESAHTALGLDSALMEAYVAESIIFSAEMRLADALKPLVHALQLDSSNVDVLSSYAMALAQVGRVDEALVQGKRARDRDPLSPTAVGVLGYLFATTGQYDSAMVQVSQASDLDPQNGLPLRQLGFFNVFAGKPERAVAFFAKAFALNPRTFGGRSNLVFGYAAAGDRREALRQRALLQRELGGNSRNYQDLLAHLAFGEFDMAMGALERGVANREPLFSNLSLPCDALFDPLKRNPRFVALMRQIGAVACPPRGAWYRALSPQ